MLLTLISKQSCIILSWRENRELVSSKHREIAFAIKKNPKKLAQHRAAFEIGVYGLFFYA